MSLAGLSLRDLEYLVAVAEHRHFGRAAAACAVSQPALSGQVRKVEALLRVTVFERGPHRQVVVTAQGGEVLAQARRVLLEARRLLDVAKAFGEPMAGPLRLGAIATLGPYLFPHLLRPLRLRFPRAELVLSEAKTADLLDALAAGDLDAALVSPPIGGEGLATADLFFEPFVLVHPPDFAPGATRPLTVDGLPTDRLLLLEEGHCLRDQALTLCGSPGAPGRERRHATSLETLRHMVAAGTGYSILPALAATPHPALDGMVRYAAFDDPGAGRLVTLAWRATDPRAGQFGLLAACIRGAAPMGLALTAPPSP